MRVLKSPEPGLGPSALPTGCPAWWGAQGTRGRVQAEADGADQADRVHGGVLGHASPGGRGSKKQPAPWVPRGQELLLAEVRARTWGAAPPRVGGCWAGGEARTVPAQGVTTGPWCGFLLLLPPRDFIQLESVISL